MATPIVPVLQDPHVPSRRMRMSLSVLKTSAASHLTQRDIQALQKKGVLHTNTPGSLQDPGTSCISSKQDQYTDLSAASAQGSSTVTPRVPLEQYTRPPLPIAERVAPMMSSLRPRLPRSVRPKNSRPGEDPRLVIHYKERPLRPYHQGTIEDTCSHLHAPVGVFRRHSDSSSPLVTSATSSRSPVSEDTLAFDPIRRASIATASPVVPTPLGGRTVLYQASHAHTLLSLPSKTALESVVQARDQFAAPTLEMSSFRFPADDSRPRTPPSPALSSTTSAMSPTIAIRSKRKSSIPIRSPNASNSPDTEPGVIFQLPFGTPTMLAMPFRKASTPSALPLSSPSASPSQLPLARSFSPSVNRDDTASSSRSRSGSEIQDHQHSLFETPRSPASRSGLGIQVQESFVEPDATQPLESSSATNMSTHTRLITFHVDSEMTIGDIIVAEQSTHSPPDQTRSHSMPTPPPTSRVQFTRVMETTASQPSQGPDDGSNANENLASPPTPFTPGFEFATSQGASSASEPTTSESNASAQAHSANFDEQNPEEAADQTLDRNVRAGSTPSTTSFKDMDNDNDNEEHDDDPASLPLWAQRQRHIRRQSLIPRPELDFVKGNGIIPPANNALVTPGGAVILSYPVLISDIVHVNLDELQAKGVTLDGSDISEESEDDGDQHALNGKGNNAVRGGLRNVRSASKRKKVAHVVTGTSKRRGSSAGNKALSHQGQGQGDEDYQSGDECVGDYDIGVEESSSSQVGYMTSGQSIHKRRRLDNMKHGSAEPEMPAPTRVVPERHTPSIYRRRDNGHNDGGDHRARRHSALSPPTSPYMESSTFRHGSKRLGSPIELETHYRDYGDEHEYDQDDVTDHDGDYDMDINIDIDDDSDEDRSHYHQHKTIRHQQVPEHLRIPAEEVEIAVKLTKEILESNKKRKLGKGAHNSTDRLSLKTLKPLLDATMADTDEQRNSGDLRRKSKSETATKAAAPKTKKAQNGTVSPKKTPSSSKANNASSSTSTDPPKRPAKAKQGKMSTKRCEACGATETPCWRPGYAPHSALCNSCGLRYKKASVFCPKEGCKFIPVKADYLLMEEERVKAGRSYLICKKCTGPIALPVKKDGSKKD
ncbi:DNA-binding transcription repressor [Mortierella sp. NVP85]|nr:DNA-binding transcription repressor [Mortierella sp. NVP85]